MFVLAAWFNNCVYDVSRKGAFNIRRLFRYSMLSCAINRKRNTTQTHVSTHHAVPHHTNALLASMKHSPSSIPLSYDPNSHTFGQLATTRYLKQIAGGRRTSKRGRREGERRSGIPPKVHWGGTFPPTEPLWVRSP